MVSISPTELQTMSVKDLLAEACVHLAGVTKLTREEMRLAGHPDSMSGDRHMHKRPVNGGWASSRTRLGRRPGFGSCNFSPPLGRFQPQKNLQLSLISLNFVRPVTPKVAGSSPVAPADLD